MLNLTKDEISELKEAQNRVTETALNLYRAEQSHRGAQHQLEAVLHKLQFRRDPPKSECR